jgi:hypothetical protein
VANNQFAIDRSASHPWALRLSNLREAALRFLREADELRGKMIQCYTNPTPPNTPDYANLEAQFGLDAGEGQACFAELDSMCAAVGIGVGDTNATIARVGVLAAIRQFVDKVG